MHTHRPTDSANAHTMSSESNSGRQIDDAPMGGNIAEKETYEELTPKQAAIVDAWVSFPTPEAEHEFDSTLENVAEEADASDSYAKEVYDSYGHIIAEHRENSGLDEAEETDDGPKRALGSAENDDSDDSEAGNSKLASERVTVPGRPTVHDKRTPDSDKEVDHFACPFCEYTAAEERTVRFHVTRETAGKHKNRNAFLDQLFIPAIATDGSEIDELDSPKTTEFKGEFTTSFLPDGVSEDSRAAEILEVAIKNPTATDTQIAEKVYGDGAKPAYVYQVLERHLSARGDDDPNGEKAETRKGWSNLTDKQQAIIREYVADPDAKRTELEERAGVSNTYSYNVLSDDKYQYVADHILARVEAGTVSLDDLDEGRALPIDFDKPTPQQIDDARPDAAEADDADSEAEGATEAATDDAEADDASATPPAAEPPAQPNAEVVRVPRKRLQKFAEEIDRLKASAMNDVDIAPDESAMAIAARKQLYAISHVEEFFRDVSDATSYGGMEADE